MATRKTIDLYIQLETLRTAAQYATSTEARNEAIEASKAFAVKYAKRMNGIDRMAADIYAMREAAEDAICMDYETYKEQQKPSTFNVRAMARVAGATGAYGGVFFQVLALTRKEALKAIYAEGKYDFLVTPVLTPTDYHIEPANQTKGLYYIITPGGEESALYTYDEAKEIIRLDKADELKGSFNMRSPSLPAKWTVPAPDAAHPSPVGFEAYEAPRTLYAQSLQVGDVVEDGGNRVVIAEIQQKPGKGYQLATRLLDSSNVTRFIVPALQAFQVLGKAPALTPAAIVRKLNQEHMSRGNGFYVDFANGCARCYRARYQNGKLQVCEIASNQWFDFNPVRDTVRNYFNRKIEL